MQKVFVLPVLSVTLLLSLSQKARSTTINFDTTPGGAAITSGADVTSTYVSDGVTFSVIPCPLGIACFPNIGTTPVAVAAPTCCGGSFAASPPNVIGINSTNGGPLNDAFNEQVGILKATCSAEGRIQRAGRDIEGDLQHCAEFGQYRCLLNLPKRRFLVLG